MADLKINPLAQVVFGIREAFVRLVRPGQNAQDVDHDYNDVGASVQYKPGGGALTFGLAYNFIVDFFEDPEVSVVNRTTHRFALGAKYQWLPRTDFNLEVSLAVVNPTDDTFKPGSVPLRIWAGANTLITPFIGLVLRAGYGNAFYSAGTSFSSYLAHAELRYSPVPTLLFAGGYTHDFTDAYIGNYFVDHTLFARYAMQIAGRWQLNLRADIRLRTYEGLVDQMGVDFCGNAACQNIRTDVVIRADAGLDYRMNAWLYLGATYTFNAVTTDFFIRTASQADSAGFVWHELLAKATARF